MFHPSNTKIDWTDVIQPNYNKIKRVLSDNRIIISEDSVETRDEDGKFVSFTITV